MSISRSDVWEQTKSKGADAKLKISNYPLKTVPKRIVKGSKVAASNKSNSAKPSPVPNSKSMTVQGEVIRDDEHSAVNSLQDQTRKDTTKSHPKEEGTSQTEKIQQAKTLANDKEALHMVLCSY